MKFSALVIVFVSFVSADNYPATTTAPEPTSYPQAQMGGDYDYSTSKISSADAEVVRKQRKLIRQAERRAKRDTRLCERENKKNLSNGLPLVDCTKKPVWLVL